MSEKLKTQPSQTNHQPESFNESWLADRIDKALLSSEFTSSPEVQEAVTGFYTDHYQLAGFLDKLMSSQEPLKPPAADQTPFVYRKRQELLAEAHNHLQDQPDDQHLKAKLISQLISAVHELFSESCLAITTITDQEINLRYQLADKVLEKVAELDMQAIFTSNNVYRDYQVHLPYVFSKSWLSEISPPPYQLAEDQAVISGEPTVIYQAGKQVVKDLSRAVNRQHLDGSISQAEDNFWSDCRQAAHLEFHSSHVAGEIMMTGLMSRNQQVRQKGFYFTGNQRALAGHHHSNAIHFSEFMPAGEYTASGGTPNDGNHHQASPATFAVPIADIIEVAPYARNAKFASLTPKPSATLDKLPAPQIVTNRIGYGGPEAVGRSPKSSLQRTFFAQAHEYQDQAPDEYALPVTGTGSDNHQPASATRAIFSYPDHPILTSWPIPLGYAFPRLYELKGDRGQEDQETVAVAQAHMAQFAKYKHKLVVPLRRGVFSFKPEESLGEDYPLAEAASYTKVTKSLGQLALAS